MRLKQKAIGVDKGQTIRGPMGSKLFQPPKTFLKGEVVEVSKEEYDYMQKQGYVKDFDYEDKPDAKIGLKYYSQNQAKKLNKGEQVIVLKLRGKKIKEIGELEDERVRQILASNPLQEEDR